MRAGDHRRRIARECERDGCRAETVGARRVARREVGTRTEWSESASPRLMQEPALAQSLFCWPASDTVSRPKTLPAYQPVDTFPVIIDQDMIKLEVD